MILSNINTMFRGDPTRTLTLRKRYETALSKRFRQLKSDIWTSVFTNDCFALNQPVINTPLASRQFAFERDPEKLVSFLAWLQKQVDNNILEVYYGNQLGSSIEEAWMNTYIRTSYEKGIGRSHQEMIAAGYTIPATVNVVSAMQMPLHIDRVGLLYTRNFTGLKGITDEMSKQIAEILAEGMATGEGPLELARRINNRVDKIGLTRAKTLAQTEMVRSHHQSMMQEFKNWGVAGVTVLAEWITAGDSRVCPLCKKKANRDNGFGSGVYTIDQVMGLIPLHPRCRCIAIPLDITDNKILLDKLKAQEN